MIEFAKSPVVNAMFDEQRRAMFGDRLLTDARFQEVVEAFVAGMKPAAIASMRSDPFWGIASKGRRGATERAALQERAGWPYRHKPKANGRVFKTEVREKRYRAALADGETRNNAMKAARRAAA